MNKDLNILLFRLLLVNIEQFPHHKLAIFIPPLQKQMFTDVLLHNAFKKQVWDLVLFFLKMEKALRWSQSFFLLDR